MRTAHRDAVFISSEDAEALCLSDGDPVILNSTRASFKGRIKISTITPKNLQVHWPEGNVLLHRGVLDPEVLIPDFNSVVEISRLW